MKTKRNPIQIGLVCAAMLQAITSGGQSVTKIAAGLNHSLFLKSDGSLWAMGYDTWGQLGDGNSALHPSGYLPLVATNRPEQIVASNVTAVAGGEWHSLLLKGDGSLWAMGNNSFGQLGMPNSSPTNRPEQIVASNVTAIVAGSYYSLFLKNDGSLWAMGDNYWGQLGDAAISPDVTYPVQIVASNVTAIAAAGGSPTPPTATGHSLFLKSDGSLWAMGYNGFGQLGDGTYNNTNQPEQVVASNVTAIAAGGGNTVYTGGGHSLFLKSDGSLWAMGDNYYGQLGDGTYNNTNQPEQIVASNVMAVAAGSLHSLFLKSDGSLWAMGDNYYGQLGDGTYNNTNQPEQIVVNPAYNQISIQVLSGGNVSLSFVGIAGVNYALDSTFNLSPPNWVPLATNPADSFGALVFTNTPNAATNNFWRIRSVP